MSKYSELLNQAISSIVNITEENDITGLEDFELIDFMVVI